MGENFPHGDESVALFFLREISYPRVFDHAEDEISSLTLGGFESGKMAMPDLVNRLFLGADQCLIIVTYRCVVNCDLAWLGERGGIV